jgi:hypothetical protein
MYKLIILITALTVFLLLEGYFCTTKVKITKMTLNLQKIITIITISIIIYYYFFNFNILYCIDDDINKKLTDISFSLNSSNINVNISNTTISGLGSIGIGLAIGGSMSAVAISIKTSNFSPLKKFRLTLIGGIVASTLILTVNLINKFIDKNQTCENDNNKEEFISLDDFNINEYSDFNINIINDVFTSFINNYTFYIIIIYLLIIIIIIIYLIKKS